MVVHEPLTVQHRPVSVSYSTDSNKSRTSKKCWYPNYAPGGGYLKLALADLALATFRSDYEYEYDF